MARSYRLMPDRAIRRFLTPATDRWEAGDLAFEVHSPVIPIPNPASSSEDSLKLALVPEYRVGRRIFAGPLRRGPRPGRRIRQRGGRGQTQPGAPVHARSGHPQLFGQHASPRGGKPRRAPTIGPRAWWSLDPQNAYWAWSDQILSGKAIASKYYPRGFTSILWLDPKS